MVYSTPRLHFVADARQVILGEELGVGDNLVPTSVASGPDWRLVFGCE
jgi:hypothetical protein